MSTSNLDPNQASSERPGATIGELVAKVMAQFSALVRDEINVTKLNAKAKVAKLGIGGVLLAVAGVIALYMLGILLIAAGFGIGRAFGDAYWLGFLIVGGVLLLVTAIVALIGVAKLKASKQHPIDPKAGLSKDLDAIKKGIQNG